MKRVVHEMRVLLRSQVGSIVFVSAILGVDYILFCHKIGFYSLFAMSPLPPLTSALRSSIFYTSPVKVIR